MANCNDCWCEHYDKNKGNCDNCVKNEIERDKPDLIVLLKKQAVEQIELESNNKPRTDKMIEKIEQGR